jgi:hypothetical protein
MEWRDQDPPAIDVLLDVTVPFSGGGSPAYLEIDKLPDGRYRATVGTLFEFQELCRTGDLEGLCCIDRSRAESGSLRSRDQAARAKSLLTKRTSPVTPGSNRMHWLLRIIRITSKPLMVA